MFLEKKLLVIAGPTASGKSQAALDLAQKINGEILNADAIQLYNEVPILSSSPSTDDKALIPHYLYNYISITENYSVGKYIEDVIPLIEDIVSRQKVPILVGGTGMYIKSLCYGMHNIPDILPEIRKEARSKLERLGNTEFYSELQKLDPLSANILHPSNSQRIVRAYEVFIQTGQSIVEFYKEKPSLFLNDYKITTIILDTNREKLYETCNKRFISMIEQGALGEVENIIKKYDHKTAASKVIGFDEIALYLSGALTKEDAIMQAQARTRQYAKRQITWFKHQMPAGVIQASFEEIGTIQSLI